MGAGQKSAWPNLALRAEIKPCIEKNSISTPFGFKSCHRRHLRRIVFWSPLLLFARWKEFARLSRLGSVRGSLFLPCWPWGESENVGPKLHVITVEGCDVPNARVGVFVARPMDLSLASQKSSTSQRIPFSRPFDLIVASPDVAFSGRELYILATFQLKYA